MPDLDSPLVVTADETLLDDALRWCAAVGVVAEVAPDLTAARRSWRQAPVVVVGEDLAHELVGAALPRREHVLLLVRDTQRWWPDAISLGASVVCAPDEEDRILEALSTALDGRGEACLVSMVGGSGGVGGSTLVVSTGLAAGRRGLRSLLFDADPLGGGLELLLGAERTEGLRWHDFDSARGRLSAGSLADVLPLHDGVSSLSWSAADTTGLPDAIAPVLTAAVRGFDLVVADVPRHLDAAGVDIIGRSVLTVLLVAEDMCGVGAARQVLSRLQQVASSIAVVSVARRGGIGPAAVSEVLGLPVLARHRADRRMRLALDRGLGPGRSRTSRCTARALLDTLGLEAP
ncbi:septum site-determining protein Ssd [Aeromicrobium sp. A1-2]|uniref:septum site-determining protein Ssd n=1 Tax=Aeromicrobium sp. A1-2 TaxID=2107713 RepID=UPI0013C2BDBB|nr:septum site-determining protein Ssd [Aeromicrobium sp. A1-2]